MKRSLATSLLALAVASCSSDDGGPAPLELGIAEECNPLGGVACLYPWPSSAYLVDDASTATGVRVALPLEAMPTNQDGISVDPAPFNRYDGFTPFGMILAAFPTGVSPDNLPPHRDVARSLAADSPIVLLDMDSGERVPFFAEVDFNADNDAERALIIRPLAKMPGGHRIAVAIRKSVRAPDGSALAIPAGFQAILDGVAEVDHPRWGALAAGYPELFAALAEEGVAQDDLVLAWDFVTASDEFLTSDLLSMRAQALPVIGDDGANLEFDAEEVPYDDPGRVLRWVSGTYDAPIFLDAGESDPSKIARGADGTPELQGTYRANFAAIIPQCVTTAELPVPVIVFGHGIFGNGEDSLDNGTLKRVAQDSCAIIIAGDFIGLTNRQLAAAALSVNDLNKGQALIEKLPQGVINFIALEQIVRGPMRESEIFSYEGTPIIDPDRVYYYGASLGGIMGNVFMAYDPFVLRGALGVPGGNWTLLMERSVVWPVLQAAMKAAYPDPWDYELNIALMGMAWDRFDAITTSTRVIADPLPGTPPKQLLLQEAIGDCLVTNIATAMTARVLGVPVIMPAVGGPPFGLATTTEPVPSALAVYDEGRTPVPPDTNIGPEEDNGTHSGVHGHLAVQRQVRRFLLDGVIDNECNADGQPAECDCAAGRCE